MIIYSETNFCCLIRGTCESLLRLWPREEGNVFAMEQSNLIQTSIQHLVSLLERLISIRTIKKTFQLSECMHVNKTEWTGMLQYVRPFLVYI